MDVVLRSAVIFAVLWLVIRLSGKREMAQLSAFDFILLVTMGDLISQSVLQEEYSLTAGTLAVMTFAALSILLGWLTFFFPKARPVLRGQATVVVRDGAVDPGVVRHEMLPYADLQEAAREAGIRDLADVELAVMEVDGSFSFFQRDQGPRQADGSRQPDGLG